MDYKAFYGDVANWIYQANQVAVQYGMESHEFWMWVADSSSVLSKKYQENQLVVKQMLMLVEWIEEFSNGVVE